MPTRRNALISALSTTLTTGLATAAGSADALAAPAPGRRHRAGAGDLTTPASLVVTTGAGRVRGYDSAGIATFKGIPYGADTGGKGRFMPPRAVAPWPGERLCMVPGGICPQHQDRRGPTPMSFLLPGTPAFEDEDCLNLNVWTPGTGDGAKRPVMVWIHGGEFSNGASLAIRATDGEALARRGDVVVVSVNHRLNALGFLDLAAVGAPAEFAGAGNVGMLDLVLALQWVRDNIAAFGGDAGNVTIFGQSGGGLKVTTLCAMPSARGLFHKAIVQSGSESRIFRREMTEPLARAFLAELGVTPAEAAKLQDLPIAQVRGAAEKVMSAWAAKAPPGDIWHMVGWAPVLDGTVIPSDPYDAKGRALSAGVPLMVGTVRHEFCFTMFSLAAENLTIADVRKGLEPAFRDPDTLIAAFAKAYPQEKPVGLWAMISAASFNRWNALAQARDHADAGAAPAFLYRFDWITPMLDGSPRAYHCSELPLVFDSIDKAPEATGTDARARTMAARASAAWIAFARTGNPSHEGIGHWQPVSAKAAPVMAFNDACRLEQEDTALLELVRSHRKYGA
ncbi:carboxylesterase/lipase family protein [Novosphingobium resinovorum]|uniref:carboxylesterase/lipase family protein n=1 Tax=Novosphingobium resinovorum TaxID=158500 RepID=UPI002ED525C5|nr:carboxylesterase family protein [Novosphingobium resinovorum]